MFINPDIFKESKDAPKTIRVNAGEMPKCIKDTYDTMNGSLIVDRQDIHSKLVNLTFKQVDDAQLIALMTEKSEKNAKSKEI